MKWQLKFVSCLKLIIKEHNIKRTYWFSMNYWVGEGVSKLFTYFFVEIADMMYIKIVLFKYRIKSY